MPIPGRYAEFGSFTNLSMGLFTLSGAPSLGPGNLANTYVISASKDVDGVNVTLIAKFGPQGRNFDSDLTMSATAEAKLGGIGITLGGIQFGSGTVSVTIGDQTSSYSRDELDTLLVQHILDRSPTSAEAAQIAADIIGVGMDALNDIANTLTIDGHVFAKPNDFTAKFIDVNSASYVDTPANVVETNGINASFSADGATRIAASGEDYVFVHVGEETDADEIYVLYRTDTEIGGSASGIQSAYNEFGEFFFSFESFLVEMFGYEPIGSQNVFNLDAEQIVQMGFDESFNFGPGTTDDGIVTGSDLADVIDNTYTDLDGTSVSAGEDIVHAGLGDDVITGGSGNDLLDGGAGTDTIILDGARDEFVFSFDTNLTVQDTAPSSGVNEGTDTLIDIELVNFSDGSRAEISTNGQGIVITYFNAGETQASARTVLDSANAYSWSSYTQTFGADGVTLIDRVTNYDDGRVLDVDYVGGVRTSQTVTDVADAFVWSDYTQTFGADGVTLVDRVTNYDDGRVLDVDYAVGVRTSQTMTDVADAFVWSDYTQTFSADGVTLIDRVTNYDDGRVLDVDYADGVRTSQTMTDVADAFVWSDYTQTFGADGVTLIDRVTNYDDGRVLDVDYAGGVRISQTMTDAADTFVWSDYTQTFGADGVTLVDRVTNYDDGRVLDVDYTGGVRTSQTMTDVADAYSWASYTQIFDISGNLISTTYLDDVA